VLRSLSTFESLYLSRSSNKLNEAIGQAFAGGTRTPPGVNDGINIARAVANELDSAKFDPLLVRATAKNAVHSLDMLVSRMDGLVCSFVLSSRRKPSANHCTILDCQRSFCCLVIRPYCFAITDFEWVIGNVPVPLSRTIHQALGRTHGCSHTDSQSQHRGIFRSFQRSDWKLTITFL
jgi:hypothetical protein